MYAIRVLLVFLVVSGCSLLVETRGEPGKFQIYAERANVDDRMMRQAIIVADNQSVHDLSGEVTCHWYSPGNAKSSFEELQSFRAPPRTKKLLGFLMLADSGQARLRLSCEVTKLICHDCGNRVVIDKESSSAIKN